MSEKPEALRLIQHMDDNYADDWDGIAIRAELRRLHADNERLRGLLLRIRAWDHLDGAADGPFWKREIDAAMEDKT